MNEKRLVGIGDSGEFGGNGAPELRLGASDAVVPGEFVKQRKSTEANPCQSRLASVGLWRCSSAMSGSYMARPALLF